MQRNKNLWVEGIPVPRAAKFHASSFYSVYGAFIPKAVLLMVWVLSLLSLAALSVHAQSGDSTPPNPPANLRIITPTYHHVRAGAAGANDGSDWNNAYTSLPATLVRGDTYYIADGSYPGYTFNDPVSGSAVITIKKATIAEHGTATGWNNIYGDGQAVFSGGFVFTTDNWVIDGQTRNESEWKNAAAYGFSVPEFTVNSQTYGSTGDNVTVRYVNVGGAVSDNFSEGHPDAGFYFGGFGQVVTGWTVSHCYIHNVDIPFQMAGADQITIEYNWIGPSWQKEIIRGQIRSTNITIRYNIMRDGCQAVPGDPPSGRVGCTAPIAIWDGSAGSFDNGAIYGNVISTTKNTNYSDGCIFIGGDGVTAAGAAANNWVVYNNTFHGVQQGNCSIRFPGSHTNDIARNNVWTGLASGIGAGCSANTCENNSTLATDYFIDVSRTNFHLTRATAAGTALSSPYNRDLDGVVRGADGTWDLGAFEF